MSELKTFQQPSEQGYYGEFGGAFIPEMLYGNVEELKANYLEILNDPKFREEFDLLLKDYAGRPTPLYFADRLSEKYGTRYLSETGRSLPYRST